MFNVNIFDDDFAVGLYKDGKDSSGGSDVGDVPIELSHLVCTFLNAEEGNEGDAEVIGKRTLENGLAGKEQEHIRCAK